MLAVPAVLALMGFTVYALDRIRTNSGCRRHKVHPGSLRQIAPITDLGRKSGNA
ncbi:MAG TPA: hypothetical protein VFA61_09085 [Candidatus Udaeobacter sp.]|nr:hypothetical protein [Candidatus Udaeobacter sp.]